MIARVELGERNKGLSERSTIEATESQVSSGLGGEEPILNLDARMYYGLEEMSASSWNLTQEPRLVEESTSVRLKEYEVNAASDRHDILTLLKNLADSGLLEVCNDATE